jgi:hypothetical protein
MWWGTCLARPPACNQTSAFDHTPCASAGVQVLLSDRVQPRPHLPAQHHARHRGLHRAQGIALVPHQPSEEPGPSDGRHPSWLPSVHDYTQCWPVAKRQSPKGMSRAKGGGCMPQLTCMLHTLQMLCSLCSVLNEATSLDLLCLPHRPAPR